MSQLPPVVIVKGTGQERRFLGATGWTAHRTGALSFETEPQARDWLASLTKGTEGATVARVEHEIENPGQPPHRSEYDPSEAA